MKKKTAVITGLTVTGVAALVGAGVALKKRKKKKRFKVAKLVEDYNDKNGNGRISSKKNKDGDEEENEEENRQSRKYILLKKYTNKDLSRK